MSNDGFLLVSRISCTNFFWQFSNFVFETCQVGIDAVSKCARLIAVSQHEFETFVFFRCAIHPSQLTFADGSGDRRLNQNVSGFTCEIVERSKYFIINKTEIHAKIYFRGLFPLQTRIRSLYRDKPRRKSSSVGTRQVIRSTHVKPLTREANTIIEKRSVSWLVQSKASDITNVLITNPTKTSSYLQV